MQSNVPSAIRNSSLLPADILASLDDDIDVVTWVNKILDKDIPPPSSNGSPSELADLDRRVTHLVGMLELASEDTSTQVERIIDDISRGSSRLTYDLHFMRDGALSLQSMLQDVEAKSAASVQADTTAALDQLYHLDTVKRNMEAAREVLREAESWGTLESDVTSLLGEQNYEKAAERLSEANKSMIVFQNTPEYENRRTLMVSLQNQLEASLSSALVAAVNSRDVVVCRNYFSIFCNIQRESEFRNYYYGSRRSSLIETWQQARLTDCESIGGSPSSTFSQFLPTFFAAFISVLQTERTSIPAIFPDPQPTLATLITSTLSTLHPTFSERLSGFSSHYGSAAIRELISAYKATEEFAVSCDKILEKIGYSALASPAPDATNPPPKSLSRRRSSARMSISGRLPPRTSTVGSATSGVSSMPALDWDQELFEPFVDFQLEYPSLEKQLLLDSLPAIISGDGRPSHDKSRLLRERAVDVFSIAEEAISRCLAFTRGYGSVGLVKALDAFFTKFVETSKSEVSSRSVQGTGSIAASTAGGDLSDLDYTQDDWADIQALLHLLEAVRALREKLFAFEGKLRNALSQVSVTLRAVREDPLGSEVSGTTRGAIQLLTQSTLNSAELQTLLDSVDPEAQRSRDGFLSVPAASEYRRAPLTGASPPILQPLLQDTRDAISALARTCQVALQDTILRPLRKRLASYPTSPLWSTPGDGKPKRSGPGSALSEIQVPTFSLSPSEIMQRVAEGLLNLPRLFDVYADDDALSFSLETLPFINADHFKAHTELPPVVPTPSNPHSRRSPSLSFKAPSAAAQPVIPDLTPEAVSATWLSSLSLTLLSHLTSAVLPSIRILTTSGAAQLASDLGYLSSIVMSLNVEYEDLDKWKEYVEMDDVAGRQKLKEVKGDSLLLNVARLRGWSS
ncbi:hypothetical protein NLI96_g5053 [Meripilus lineatus]|uniref:Conserved oligomeric Golgi complex subunit 7 n=1 Tax=Meripilus lineatus TaxID=2056292 RepID=A0AAD5YE83_9APHY|nr:hypothetical protein NLI96_g5053 [Physisporinus lineatus]